MTARFLATIMIIPHLMLAGLSTAVNAQVQGTTYVAVIDFANTSKYGDAMLSRLATDAVAVEMANTAATFTVATRQQVESAMRELDISYPLDLTGVLRISEQLQVDSVIVGELRDVRFTENPRQARVELVVRMLDAETGEPINGAIARGQSTPQPSFTGDDDLLVTQAINNAAYVGVKRMVDYIIPEATILNSMGSDEVLLNRGAQDGINEGMEMIVSRNDEVIGKIRVIDVSNNDARAKVVSAVRGVQPQDKAKAIFKLPAVASGAYGEPASRISGGIIGTTRKSNSTGKLLGIVLGVALLLGLAGSHSKGGETPGASVTASAGAPPALATPSGLPGVKITLDPGRFGATNQNIIQYKIYRSDQAEPVWAVARNTPMFVDYILAAGADPRDFTYYDISTQTDATELPDQTDGLNEGPQLGQTYTYSASVVYSRQAPDPDPDEGSGIVQIYEEGSVQTIGTATPISPVLRQDLIQPAFNSAAVDPANVTFEWRSVLGADTYIVEVATDPAFRNVVYRSGEVQASRFSEGQPVLLENVSLSANLVGVSPDATLYWRVGARQSMDDPGPVPDPATGLRFVYGETSQFRSVAGPPPPP